MPVSNGSSTAKETALGDGLSGVARIIESEFEDAACHRRVLEAVASQTSAIAAALWQLAPSGALSCVCQLGLAESGIAGDAGQSRRNAHWLLQTARLGRPQICSDVAIERAVAGRAASIGGRETDIGATCMLAAPVGLGGDCTGLLQIFLGQQPPHGAGSAMLDLLEQTARLLARHRPFWRAALPTAEDRPIHEPLLRAVESLHRSLRTRQVALVAVHEAQRLLDFDRVSLCVARGRRAVPLAISGQQSINRASATVRSIGRLALASIRGNQEFGTWLPTAELPSAMASLLAQHALAGGGQWVWVAPLHVPAADAAAAEAAGTGAAGSAKADGRAFAALVCERFGHLGAPQVSSARLESFARHVAQALDNARRHESTLARWFGPLRPPWGGWGAARLLAALAAALAVTAALICTSRSYRVEGRGKLLPVLQRRVFAPADAEVVAVLVTGGEKVQAGQPLLKLRNDQLELELLAARNALAEREQQRDALIAETDEAVRRGVRPDELARLRGRIAQARIDMGGSSERIEALSRQIEQLLVRAPIAGTVANFKLEEALLGRPVRRGETLLEVMDESGDWRLEIAVPEQRMGHVMDALQRQPRLPVECVLATAPDESFSGYVDRLATRTEVAGEMGSVVEVHVALASNANVRRRIGAEAVAKIDCGQRSLGYVLFGDFFELLQRTFW